MKVKSFVNGELFENCYLVYSDKDALIIDPGLVIKELEEFVKENNLKVLSILITHYHFDHICGLEYYKDLYNVNVVDYKSDLNNIDPFKFEILSTPGHTKDSVCFYFSEDKIMFTGDALFKETIGNYKKDDESDMYKSLTNILQYPSDTVIYPGHDEVSTLGHEKEYNMYLRGLK